MSPERPMPVPSIGGTKPRLLGWRRVRNSVKRYRIANFFCLKIDSIPRVRHLLQWDVFFVAMCRLLLDF